MLYSAHQSKTVNLCLVGTWGVGKRTFTNALLNEKLFNSKSLEELPAAAIIEYSATPFVNVIYVDDKTYYTEFSGKNEELNSIISQALASVHGDISYIVVGISSIVLLEHNLRIINMTRKDYYKKSFIYVLRNMCDIPVVIMDSSKVLSHDDRDFIESMIAPYFRKFPLVLTRYDKIDSSERQAVLDYVNSICNNSFTDNECIILPFSLVKGDLNELAAISESTIRRLFSLVEEFREPSSFSERSHVQADSGICDSDSCIWETVKDLININEHIDFASDLIGKYSWELEEERNLWKHLSMIRDKQNDECLNLSVIGEFSSGKSSFVNALLKEEILVSSILQGTTVVNTIIEYSPSLYIKILYTDNKTKTITPLDNSELRQRLSQVTTDGNNAQDISFVYVGIPSSLLKSKIRIIDTPGTSSLVSWHEDVTKRALKEISDLSIILTDAVHPMPQSLTTFMEENLSSIFSQCAIAVTRFDLVPENERKDVLDYIEKQVKTDFDVKDMLVLPFAALALLGEMKGEKMVDDQRRMADLSEASCQRFFAHMAEKRQVSQIKKMLALIGDVFDYLNSSINRKKCECDKELHLLEKSQQADLEPFIRRQQTELSNSFLQSDMDLRVNLIEQCEQECEKAKKRLIDGITNLETVDLDAIKSYMSGEFIEQCKTETDRLTVLPKRAYGKQLNLFQQSLKNFQLEFNRQFERLEILKIDFDTSIVPSPSATPVKVEDIKGALDYISSELDKINYTVGGGMAAGAGVGFFIGGPVGGVIGGIIGGVIGAANGTDIDTIKANTAKKVTAPLDSLFLSIKQEIMHAYDKSTQRINTALENEIGQYLSKYKIIIDKRIKENKAKQNSIQSEKNEINHDLLLIETHRSQLQSVMYKIK